MTIAQPIAQLIISETGLASLAKARISIGWLRVWIMSAGAGRVDLELIASDGWQSQPADWRIVFATPDELDSFVSSAGIGDWNETTFTMINPEREGRCLRNTGGDGVTLLIPVGDIGGQRKRWLPMLAGDREISPVYVYADEAGPCMPEPGLSAAFEPREGRLLSDKGRLLEECVLKRLKRSGLMVRTVESCTAGAIAARLCRVPGSSAVVDRGWITYSNEAKTEEMGVSPAVIARQGAVSKPVVCTMAEGGMEHNRVCVAVSGIAGPGGGTDEKPVGTVWVAVALEDHATVARCLNLSGARHEIQSRTVVEAMVLLLEMLETL